MEQESDTIILYRPTGPNELELVKESEYKSWPPRLPGQPIFYPVTNEQYAKEIATKWNIKDSDVGASYHTEWWVPADDLEELNKNIVALIEVIGEYRA